MINLTREEIDKLGERGLDFGANKPITDGSYDKDLAIACQNGTFVGVKEKGVLAWKGIPFAKPPVGNLRFMAPVKPDDSDGVYEAYNYGKSPINLLEPSDHNSEDCLYLNVFTGDDNTSNKPVMVWIHGGAFLVGSASDYSYRGESFAVANPDIVFVTIEYRLGMFGFTDFEGIPGSEEDTANNAIKDQLAALRWIKENIAGFGGSPDNITVFGESAGGISTALLPLVDGTEGLFHKIIVQSGAPGTLGAPGRTKKGAKAICDIFNVSTMEEMQQIPIEDILAQGGKISGVCPAFGPSASGILIPSDPYKAYAEGKASHVQVLAGSTADECRYFINRLNVNGERANEKAFLPWMQTRYEMLKKLMTPEEIELADKYIASVGESEAFSIEKLMTDLSFGVGTRIVTENAAKHNDAYIYYFAYPTHFYPVCADHGSEVDFIFNKEDSTMNRTGDYEGMQNHMREIWTSFAKTGVPTIDGVPCKKYNDADKPVIVFGKDGKVFQEDKYLVKIDQYTRALAKYESPAIVMNFAPPYEDYFTFGILG